ncbi:hypothetical protein DOY81_012587, partial [Sarcophaga bullata]
VSISEDLYIYSLLRALATRPEQVHETTTTQRNHQINMNRFRERVKQHLKDCFKYEFWLNFG